MLSHRLQLDEVQKEEGDMIRNTRILEAGGLDGYAVPILQKVHDSSVDRLR
jgi:hypothetical protein